MVMMMSISVGQSILYLDTYCNYFVQVQLLKVGQNVWTMYLVSVTCPILDIVRRLIEVIWRASWMRRGTVYGHRTPNFVQNSLAVPAGTVSVSLWGTKLLSRDSFICHSVDNFVIEIILFHRDNNFVIVTINLSE